MQLIAEQISLPDGVCRKLRFSYRSKCVSSLTHTRQENQQHGQRGAKRLASAVNIQNTPDKIQKFRTSIKNRRNFGRTLKYSIDRCLMCRGSGTRR
jgi:hypothetical protein